MVADWVVLAVLIAWDVVEGRDKSGLLAVYIKLDY